MDISVCLDGDLIDKTTLTQRTNFRPDQYHGEGDLLLLMLSSDEVNWNRVKPFA